MKKVNLIAAACALILSFSSVVLGAGEYYLSGNVGLAKLGDTDISTSVIDMNGYEIELEFKNGFGFGLAGGYELGNNIRIEGEIAHQSNEVDQATRSDNLDVTTYLEGDVSSLAILANGYYDFANQSALTPFLSAGLGFAKIEYESSEGESDDDTVFAYQIGAGVGYALSERLFIDAKYRYFATSEPDLDGVKIDYSSHNFYVGVRASF